MITVSWPVLALSLVTFALLALALRAAPTSAGHYGEGAVIGLLYFLSAALVSALLWLIWALAA